MQLYGDGSVGYRRFGDAQEQIVLQAKNWPGFAGDCVYHFQNHVVEHLLDNGPIENTAAEYIDVLRLEELVYQSNEDGRKLNC